MKSKILTIATCLTLGGLANAQLNVNIPDTNFKNALLAHGASAPVNGVNPITGTGISLIDANNDGDISTTEAQNYTGTINVHNKSISDLTGIEAFVNLTKLFCNANQLTSLDVSANTALTVLNCLNNQLNNLDVSANTALTKLYCSVNQLTSLDVSANTALTVLNCFSNQLTSLNVANGNNGSSHPNLYQVNATNNPNLTCIQHDTGFDPTTATYWYKDGTASWSDNCPPVSSCANIVNIPDANFKNALLAHGTSITGAGISTIDTDGDGEICQTEAQAYTGTINVYNKSISDLTGIEAFVNLTKLYCTLNQLTSVDVSANTALTELYCHYNQLSSLDVSANTALTKLRCDNNQLTSLNVANGNNGVSSSNLYYMRARVNSNLTCIQHDTGFDPTIANFWTRDATASWSTNCSGSSCANIVNIPDANFKNALLAHGSSITGAGISTIDTDGDGEICQTEAQAYTGTINVNNQTISDLTGIEAFIAITHLDCSFNSSLNTLDVSANTALTLLECYRTSISSLDVSNNTSLNHLVCDNTGLTSLDVSANTALEILECFQNYSLTSLNVANGSNGANPPNLFKVTATSTPNLTCIQHDTGFDPTTASQWTKDATASWSDNCSSSGGGTSSINENNISFSIVPNPTSGMVKIETEVEINSIEVFSMTGQKIQSSTEKTIDLSEVKSGIYFVKVLSDGGSFTARIIRE